MLKLENISKTYAKSKTKAVDDFSLSVNRGEIFGFIGPNGAGKTTTIKMIMGILRPDSGTITIDGIDISKKPVTAKKKISYVPDNQDIYDRLTGKEYLNFIADVYRVDKATRAAQMEKYLTMFHLKDAVDEQIRTYSHGMRQKLMLTAALIPDPELWVLDEPMVGLDPKSAHELKKEMRSHCDAGNTVFFSTHVLEVAEKLCDRIAIIDNGKLIAVGSVEELKQSHSAGALGGESLESIFLSLTEDEEDAQ
ncbi:MAG: ABC transporter ATP-binding protein [Clostridia bacterium]|nr:ABC transporter ATP-binding protein [Clostridia bacterium]